MDDFIFQTHSDRTRFTLSALHDRARSLLSTIKVGSLENGVLVLSSQADCDAAFEVVDAAGLSTMTLG